VRWGAHAIVIGVLALSGTSGAVIAYATGLAIHFGALLHRHWRMLVLTLVSLGGLTVTGLMVSGGESLFPETRLSRQIAVMRTELNTVIEGGEVAYYDQERVLGPGAASGIWRLVHWRKTINMYAKGTAAQQLTGFGIGSSAGILGKLPHNEYLRVLFEQGIVGLALFLYAWRRIIRTAPRDVQYCGVILAVYSFSENNLDNFPFMSLFILCLSAAGAQIHAARREKAAPEAIQQTY
jgi:O-antigen ligase